MALPMLHAFTGCGTVSYFLGKGKKRHGKCGCHLMMSLKPSVTQQDTRYLLSFCAYNYTADKPFSINESINLLERFIVLL